MSWQSKVSAVWPWNLTWCWNPRCGPGRRCRIADRDHHTLDSSVGLLSIMTNLLDASQHLSQSRRLLCGWVRCRKDLGLPISSDDSEGRKLAENHGIKIQCLKLATNRADELLRVKGQQAQLNPRGWLGRRARVYVEEVACNWRPRGELVFLWIMRPFRRRCTRELAVVQTKPDFYHFKQGNFCLFPF
jgi:hypothetical protein